jgi:hypothetical protein
MFRARVIRMRVPPEAVSLRRESLTLRQQFKGFAKDHRTVAHEFRGSAHHPWLGPPRVKSGIE